MDPLSFYTKDIEILIGITTFAAITFLGGFVYLKNRKSWTHRLFLLLAIVFDAYIIFNYLSLHPPGGRAEDQLFWIRMVMFSASFKGPLIFLLLYTFPHEKIQLSFKKLLPILALMGASAASSLLPLVFKGIEYVNGEPVPVPGAGMPIFVLNFMGPILLSIFVIIFNYREANAEEKAKQFYLVSGVLFSLILIGLFSLVFVVLLHNSNWVFMSPIFLVIFITSIAYAISRYQLFNFKIIGANLLILVMWMILFSRIFTEKSFGETIVDFIVFVATVIFGALLINSVKKEVEAKEKIEAISEELEMANRRLEEMNKMKSEFVSFASHQLKSPLAVIKGYADLIADGSYGTVSIAVEETAIKIKNAANRLVTLIEDFLNIKRIEDGTMQYVFEERNIVEFVKNIKSDYELIAHEKGLEISFGSNATEINVKIDTSKMRQVIQNLLDNSIKYTPHGWVRVAVHLEGDYALIIISDSGRGISKDYLPKLFERYHREAVQEGKAIEGSGLGLYIARQIILAHKGEIRAESDGEDKGSAFYIRIPVSRETSQMVS